MMRIYLANKKHFKRDELKECFKKILENNQIRQDSMSVDQSVIETMTRRIYRNINKNRSVNKFVPFWEETITQQED
jgi:hypothetical protein